MFSELYENVHNVRFFSFQTEEYEKMEKADILEMAVNHLKNLKKTQLHPGPGKYLIGFS